MKTCFLSGAPLLELPGEVVAIPRRWLDRDVAPRVHGDVAYAYRKLLAASPEAQELLLERFVLATGAAGLAHVADVGDGMLVRDEATRSYVFLAPGGESSTLPTLEELATGERIPPWRFVARRFPLRIHGLDPALARVLQHALRTHGTVSLAPVVDAYGIEECLMHPARVRASVLTANPLLRAEWGPDRIAAVCATQLPILEDVVCAVRNAESGIGKESDLRGLLARAEAVAAVGTYEGRSEAIALLERQEIYFRDEERARIQQLRHRIQQELFEERVFDSPELDAWCAARAVDPTRDDGVVDVDEGGSLDRPTRT